MGQARKRSHFDVIVLGAGAAGLAVASRLAEAGKKFVVLEARDRVGGRVHSLQPGLPLPVELGAEFVHGKPEEIEALLPQVEDNPVYELTDRHHRVEGKRIVPVEGFWEEIGRVFAGIPRRGRDQSFAEYLLSSRAGREAKDLAKSFVEGFDAADSRKISAQSLASLGKDLAGEGTALHRFLRGYEGVLEALVTADVRKSIRLRSVARLVRWRRGVVEVEAEEAGGRRLYHAAKLVVALPLGVLKAPPGEKGAIEFSPRLPAKEAALEKLEMGEVVKVLFWFDQLFWEKWKRKAEGASFLHFPADSFFQVAWTCAPFDYPLVCCWSGGPRAARLDRCGPEDVICFALSALSEALQFRLEFLHRHLRRWFFHDWSRDPFSRGAYSYLGVGGAYAQTVLAKPEAGTIFFAGEALQAEGQTGTVDAALASGYSAARRVLRGA